MTDTFIVAVSVADIHREPDASSELVTQALMNTPAQADDAFDPTGLWTHITLPDYSGWIKSDQLDELITRGFCEGIGTCGVALPFSVVVIAPSTPLYRAQSGEERLGELYLSTRLPYIDLAHPERLRVALPGDGEGWVPRGAVEIRANDTLYPRQELSIVTDYARAFLDIPYFWGGTTYRGIDCSGFVQLCYRMGGDQLPRDANQQHDFLSKSLEQSELREGDLLFFGRQEITHVALALTPTEYIHAEGQQFNKVTITSLDPTHQAYNAYLKELICGYKRVRT